MLEKKIGSEKVEDRGGPTLSQIDNGLEAPVGRGRAEKDGLTFAASNVEPPAQFERRKQEHIRLSLDPKNQAIGGTGLEKIKLIHEAFPEIDFSEVSLEQESLGLKLTTPLLVSSMTAGHVDSLNLNILIAKACQTRGWLMGVGSQRRELTDLKASNEWREVRKVAPKAQLLGNLGLSQLIVTPIEDVERLVETIQATAMIIHTNPLQECLQPEGTPQFRGGLSALEKLCRRLSVPVVVKETGCGFSRATLERLKGTGVAAVDVSGFGGTHWGRIEGGRSNADPVRSEAAQTFADWGIGTVDSLCEAVEARPDYEIWASGGVRSGLDAVKLLAMGAKVVGLAKPILAAALEGEPSLYRKMETIEYEMKTALFCTGCVNPAQVTEKKAWKKT